MATFNTINSLAQPVTITTGTDTTQPYNFQDWKARNTNIPIGNAFEVYSLYVKNWYINRDTNNVAAINYVAQYYQTFLQSLGVTARTAAEAELFNNVVITDQFSLQSTIVGYARKLKDVAVYLANKRNSIVYSKLKSNLNGTAVSLERMFYSYILTAFTRKITPDGIITNSFVITNPDILNSLPYLSTIAGGFNIEIQEVYDTSNYFDRDPSVSISTYTTVASGTPAALYEAGEYSIPEDYLIASVIGTVATTNISSMATTPTYFTFTGDGSTTTFTISNIISALASNYQVTIDGIVQTPDTSYSISTQNQTITFTEVPPTGSIIVIVLRY